MIKKLRKLMRVGFLSMLVTAFGVVSTGAYALTNNTVVTNTGDKSDVETEVKSTTNVSVSNANSAMINQLVQSSSNTGNNSAKGNISSGGGGSSILTGPATTAVQANVNANANTTLLGLGGSSMGSNATEVLNTADRANVETEVENEVNIAVDNYNLAKMNQFVDTSANTGFNRANGNVGSVEVTTGGASVGVDLEASANENLTLIGGTPANGGLENSTIITNTGDKANVETEVENETNLWVGNTNLMFANQKLMGSSNSGYNAAKGNIGNTEVTTGSALLLSSLGLGGNTNATGIEASVLSPDVESLVDIVNTGKELDSESEMEMEMNVAIENDNNLFSSQMFLVSSNTGYSKTNKNIGGSSVLSGASGTGAESSTSGNTNMTAIGMLGTLLNLLAL